MLSTLRAEIDVAWPNRSMLSDGTIGDDLHKARKSHHNPDQYGYVRAIDLTKDDVHGPPMAWLADYLRGVGKRGSQRLAIGGYVIFDRRIASEQSEWTWLPYTGDDPHVGHLHLSCSQLPAFYKITRPWHVEEAWAGHRLARDLRNGPQPAA